MIRMASILTIAAVLALASTPMPAAAGPGPDRAPGTPRVSASLTDGSALFLRPGERLRLTSAQAGAGRRWTVDRGCRLSDRRAVRPILRCHRSGVHDLRLESRSSSISVTVVVVKPRAERGTGRLAYVFRDPAGGDLDIWTVRADGSDRRRLTDNTADDFAPSWSPDGRRLAFTSNRSGNNDLYVMNADGSRQRQVTRHPAAEGGASSWSPDGRRIAFTSQRAGNRDVHTIAPDGGGEVNLSRNPGEDRHPSWSPDGATISFHSQRAGDVDLTGYDVYVMNADGSRQRDVSRGADSGDGEAAWQPRRGTLGYVSYQRPDGFDDVYVHPRHGGPARNLTGTADAAELEPAWSPSGRWLSYDRTADYERSDLYLARADGSGRRLLVSGGYDSAWQPR